MTTRWHGRHRYGLWLFFLCGLLGLGACQKNESSDKMPAEGHSAIAEMVLDQAAPTLEGRIKTVLAAELENNPQSPRVAEIRSDLAGLYLHQKRFREAIDELEKALMIFQAHYGPLHGYSREAMEKLAEAQGNSGNYSAAESIYRKELAMGRQSSGEGGSELRQPLMALGAIYFAQARLEEAEAMYRELLALEVRIDPGSLACAHAHHNLSLVLLKATRAVEALAEIKAAEKILVAQLGQSSEEVLRTQKQRAYIEARLAAGSEAVGRP